MRFFIRDIIKGIKAFDDLEAQHIQETLAWIEAGFPIFRLTKPANPPQHLVCYFVVFDVTAQKLLLVDHKKAQLWLPSGGHVEDREHPVDAVRRECMEELGIRANFWQDQPLFLTITRTGGLTPNHTDVSLWYVLRGDSTSTITFDVQEFTGIQWFSLDKIPYERTDPHMPRFVNKLKSYLVKS